MKRCGLKFDDMGKSKGIADIEYEKEEEAAEAIKEYESKFNLN